VTKNGSLLVALNFILVSFTGLDKTMNILVVKQVGKKLFITNLIQGTSMAGGRT
jgi:hypothetical protein